VTPSRELVLGAALLDLFGAWDGDLSMVTDSVREQFNAVARRLAAYASWCAEVGIDPARRPDDQGDESAQVCGDCIGSGIVRDDDGSLSGFVGTLIDCGCSGVPCLGLGTVEVCTSLLGRSLTLGERRVALVVEYLADCRVRRVEPCWCLTCGAYVADGAACGCRT
jgi:hypothetical protein